MTVEAHALVRPFELDVPHAALDGLAARRDATRWPDEAAVPGRPQGVPPAYPKEPAAYWRTVPRPGGGYRPASSGYQRSSTVLPSGSRT
ncbi:epoxide hydrolase N-terminal domain-containing protein [Sphaerisporangium sp. NPDC005288]|uniref:epoxide hydrolase N-terminal domain-containing protein n=1 Tax=Sphaerisporangium sp. NPDC005288 TaxID=3155114 RepID=UPI00339E755B